MWVETLRNIFIADYNNYLIRKVSYATGIIATIAGIGTSGTVTAYNNTAATSAKLLRPTGVWGDTIGNVYFTDTYQYKIAKVVLNSGIIYIIAGE